MKYVDVRDLPPCSFSPECLRLIDDLEVPAVKPAFKQLAYINDFQDERRLRQLRVHVSSCATCSALLADARRMRTQQRTTLYYLLLANEKHVPSTTDAIFTALRAEQARESERRIPDLASSLTRRLSFADRAQEEQPARFPLRFPVRSSHRSGLFHSMLTLITLVAVILAAVGILNYFSNQPVSTARHNPLPRQPESPGGEVGNGGWDSVIVGLTFLSATGLARGFTIYGFDTLDDNMTSLLSSYQDMADMHMEGVSNNGQSLLYDVTSPHQQKTFKTFSLASSFQTIYSSGTDQAGNAIWMDASHILVQDSSGSVSELDVSSGALLHSWPVKSSSLLFYHQPFLYFLATGSASMSALYRVDLAQPGATARQLTGPLPDPRFWLSPDGSTISYAEGALSGGEMGAYSVASNGTNAHSLGIGGVPVGYTANNALMVIQQVGEKLQILKMGTASQQKTQVVFADAAPEATSLCGPSELIVLIAICSQNIALDPYGHGLLLHAYYADGSSGLIYDDLDTGVVHRIWNVPGDSSVQLSGWSKLSPGAQSSTAPSNVAHQTGLAQSATFRPLAESSREYLALCA